MKAYWMDNVADIFSEEAEPVPIAASAWGIVDIKPDGVLEEGQEAGIVVFIDQGPTAYQVEVSVAECLAMLHRATGGEGGQSAFHCAPDKERIQVQPLEPAVVILPNGNRVELAPGDRLELENTESNEPEEDNSTPCDLTDGVCSCPDVEDLV